MRTKIASLHFKASETLKDFAQLEVGRLEKFTEDIIGCEIEFTFTKAQKEAHIHLNVDGTVLNALGASDDFMKSTVLAVDKLEQQLKKLKGKMQSKRAAGNGE